MTLPHRIEQAEGADRALDADIELAIGNWSPEHYEAWHRYQQCGESVNPPMCAPVDPQWFTASIDAALTLVPSGDDQTAVFWQVGNDGQGGNPADFLARVLVCSGFTSRETKAVATTPALALCAAALRAKESSDGE